MPDVGGSCCWRPGWAFVAFPPLLAGGRGWELPTAASISEADAGRGVRGAGATTPEGGEVLGLGKLDGRDGRLAPAREGAAVCPMECWRPPAAMALEGVTGGV